MIFRRLRKFLKPRLARYPAAMRLYEATSWAARIAKGFVPNRAKRFFPKIVDVVFPMWIGPRVRLAQHYFGDGKPDKAIAVAEDVFARTPDLYMDEQTLQRIASIYYLDGRYEDARRVFKRTEECRRREAGELQYDRLGLRFFSTTFFGIGALGSLDRYVKADVLGVTPRRMNVILGAPEHSANPAYLRYWEKYFSVVTHPRTISRLAPLCHCLEERSNWIWCGGNFAAIAREAQLKWEAEGREALLELNPEHRERGRRLLRDLGVPEGAWFVGLHVRETKGRSIRDADIRTYGLAVEEIARRGGWVLRIGGRGMRPLPSWPNCVDFARSARREDWTDVFVWAEGRFFVGTGSGPQLIPTSFGKPVAIANYGPIAAIVCGKDDVLLPKHYWVEREGRYLTLTERMNPNCAIQESPDVFAKLGIRVVDNTPEELRDLAVEMIDRSAGRHVETDQERQLQARFAELAATHAFYPVRIARAFMSRHPDLF
jgi:putative glycosyltransferase (TIGR04372 family)